MEILFWVLVALWIICAISWIVSISVKKFRENGTYLYLVLLLNILNALILIINAIHRLVG